MVSKKVWIGIVVLLVILGGFWIFWNSQYIPGAKEKSVVDMTPEELEKLWGRETEPSKILTFASLTSNGVSAKGGELSGFAFKVNNLLGEDSEFSYEITLSSPTIIQKSCNTTPEEAESWISIGGQESFIIANGESFVTKVLIFVPENQPLCTVKYKINLYDKEGKNYASENVTMNIRA